MPFSLLYTASCSSQAYVFIIFFTSRSPKHTTESTFGGGIKTVGGTVNRGILHHKKPVQVQREYRKRFTPMR